MVDRDNANTTPAAPATSEQPDARIVGIAAIASQVDQGAAALLTPNSDFSQFTVDGVPLTQTPLMNQLSDYVKSLNESGMPLEQILSSSSTLAVNTPEAQLQQMVQARQAELAQISQQQFEQLPEDERQRRSSQLDEFMNNPQMKAMMEQNPMMGLLVMVLQMFTGQQEESQVARDEQSQERPSTPSNPSTPSREMDAGAGELVLDEAQTDVAQMQDRELVIAQPAERGQREEVAPQANNIFDNLISQLGGSLPTFSVADVNINDVQPQTVSVASALPDLGSLSFGGR